MRTTDQSARIAATPARPPLVSVILPVFNESGILETSVAEVLHYIDELRASYRFEIIIVDDGSRDGSGEIADAMAARYEDVRVYHHPTNFGVGQALKYGFAVSQGDYVIVLDTDLSYDPSHIGLLLRRITTSSAKVVLASPYMAGGQLTQVPRVRRFFSVWGNRFLRLLAKGDLSTLTCMVRAFDGPFIRSLPLTSTGMDIMPEMIHKTMVVRGRIEEVPGHLDWSRQRTAGPQRTSSMRIAGHILATVLSGFVFRPVAFLVVPGLIVLLFSLYVNAWMIIHFLDDLLAMAPGSRNATIAFAEAYASHPHTFITAFLSLMLSIQLIGLGLIALQAEKYFEELFYLGTSVRRMMTGFPFDRRGR